MTFSFILKRYLLIFMVSIPFLIPELVLGEEKNSLLLDAAIVSDQLITVGERGIIMTSVDGHTWSKSTSPVETTLTSIFFIDNNNGWAVGHDSVILHSADGGLSWSELYSNPENEIPLFDIYFSSSHNGFAVGAFGSIIRTTDGGATWSEDTVSMEEDFHLYGITVDSYGHLFLAGESGSIYHSEDNGVNWQRLSSAHNESYFGILTAHDDKNNDVLVAFGLIGQIAASYDHGKNWTAINVNTQESLQGGVVFPNGQILLVGLNGTGLISNLDFSLFNMIDMPGKRGYVTGLLLNTPLNTPNTKNLFLFGEDGVKYTSLQLQKTGYKLIANN